MAKKITETLDVARISSIADAMYQACNPFMAARNDLVAAKEAATAEGEKEVSLRETIMANIAALSVAGQWTKAELKVATKNAAAKINDKSEKTLATFISETRRAAEPLVRDHFLDLLALRDKAWADEMETKAIDKDAPTPIKHAFKRKYHFLLTGLLGAAEQGRILTTVDECIAYAEENDPSQNAAKVFAKLEALRSELADIAAEFPVDDIGAAVDALNTVTKEIMVAAQQRKGADAHAEIQHISPPVVSTPAKVVVAPTPAVKPVAAPPATVVVSNDTIQEGAIDLLDDILGDHKINLVAA